MPILDAVLAFALTMLVVATIVTQVVNLRQRFGNWYANGLDEMLKGYFASEVGTAVKRVIERLTGTSLSRSAEELVTTASKFDWRKHIWDGGSGDDRAVSRETLMEAFQNSYLDKEFRKELGGDTKAVYKELERRYKVAEEKATDRFKRRSQKWGTCVALVLAFVFNIDSVHIAHSYIRNPALRQGVVAQMQVIAAEYEAVAESTADSEDDLTMAALGEAIGDMRQQVDLLTTTGFPIGWSRFPHAGLKDTPTLDHENRNNTWGWVLWVVGVTLTGILAGFGSPFWFDAVTGISRATRARAVKKPDSCKDSAQDPAGP
jgi:hypothetical protein